MKIAYFLHVLLLLSATATSHAAALIDFETTPGGGTPTDNGILPAGIPYTLGGVQVTFGFDANSDGVVDGNARFERAGTFPGEGANIGFQGSSGTDTPDPGFGPQLGNWFLRSPLPGSDFGQFIITYVSTSSPVTAASGEIWDIDGNTQLGMGVTEEYTVTAYDAANNVLGLPQVSPLGVLPSSVAPLDGKPWQFAFSGLSGGIDHIIVDFTGSKTMGIGLAFNNFYPTAVPEPSTAALIVASMLGLAGRRRGRG